MEESRLKPMVENYNPALFQEIYNKTKGLRIKLASGIDHRRFGVDNDEVLSWFDVKFIFAYNKYVHKHTPDELLGYMIKAMQFFKCRILRKAYTNKYSQQVVEFTGNEHTDELIDDPREAKTYYYEILMTFMKKNLSDNAYELLDLKLNPPPYIISRIKDKKNSLHKIPADLILEYYGLELNDRNLRYIKLLNQEIEDAQRMARSHFNKS